GEPDDQGDGYDKSRGPEREVVGAARFGCLVNELGRGWRRPAWTSARRQSEEQKADAREAAEQSDDLGDQPLACVGDPRCGGEGERHESGSGSHGEPAHQRLAPVVSGSMKVLV